MAELFFLLGTPGSTKVFICESSPSAIAGLPHNLEHKIPGDSKRCYKFFLEKSKQNIEKYDQEYDWLHNNCADILGKKNSCS